MQYIFLFLSKIYHQWFICLFMWISYWPQCPFNCYTWDWIWYLQSKHDAFLPREKEEEQIGVDGELFKDLSKRMWSLQGKGEESLSDCRRRKDGHPRNKWIKCEEKKWTYNWKIKISIIKKNLSITIPPNRSSSKLLVEGYWRYYSLHNPPWLP